MSCCFGCGSGPADAKVTRAEHDAAPAAESVTAALLAVAKVIGEVQTVELLGVSLQEIRSARRTHKDAGTNTDGVANSP
jgi:hypothetical protein